MDDANGLREELWGVCDRLIEGVREAEEPAAEASGQAFPSEGVVLAESG